ncbi:MAG: hypothetical protein BWY19_00433 [bacterium ADurb.Bin212]|nr:MAG: hypothetical protein BWY19_00433 [bacterium ADurb.Bin212]
MQLKIKKVDKLDEIPINSELQRIEQIKSEISACAAQPDLCEVEVFDMWDDLRNNS